MFGPILHKLKTVLATKAAGAIIVLVVIAGRISQLSYLFNIRSDRSNQILAAQNLISGHGISLAYTMPAGLSDVIYEPLIKWPPAYSYIYSVFYSLFDQNYIAAALAIDILFAIILIIVTRAILKILDLPAYLVNLYTLLSGFLIYSFYLKPSSDAVAITFFLIAIYFFLGVLKSNSHYTIKAIGIIIALFLSGATKYLYIPIIFIIPSLLILKGWNDNNRSLKKAGLFSFLALAISIGALLLFQKTTGGSAVYITQPNRGFFPENLLSLYPTWPASFIDPESVRLFTGNNTATLIYRALQLIHILISVIVIVCAAKTIFKKGFKTLTTKDLFFYLSFFIWLAVTALLIALSLNIEKEDGYWTYVQEARYYGLPVLLLQLCFFLYYYHHKTNRIFRYLFFAGIILMLPGMARGVLFSASRIVNFNKETPSWKIEYQMQQYAEAVIQKAKEKHSVNNVVLAGSSDYVNNRISIYSHIPQMKNIAALNDMSMLNTKTPTLLLVVLRSDALPGFQPFLANSSKEVAGSINGFYFYTVYVAPH